MLRFEMLAADHGDALLLEYGPGRRIRYRILIDAGPETPTPRSVPRLGKIRRNRSGRRTLNLLVISHVDADHIEGVIKLLQDKDLAIDPRDVWFNDWNHLEPLVAGETPTHLGPEQGEFLGALLEAQERPWNLAFDRATVVVPPSGSLTTRRIGGMRLTVVSPTVDTLISLREKWKSAIRAAGFEPGRREHALKQFRGPALGTRSATTGGRKPSFDTRPFRGQRVEHCASR